MAAALLGDGWHVETADDGRPMASGGDGTPPSLSISHSGAWVAVALAARGSIGIDLERRGQGRDYAAIAQAYFTSADAQTVLDGGETAFLALWTMREALAKAAGGGVARALSMRCDALAGLAGGTATIVVDGHAWMLAHRDCGEYHLALAWSEPDGVEMLNGAIDRARSSIRTAP